LNEKSRWDAHFHSQVSAKLLVIALAGVGTISDGRSPGECRRSKMLGSINLTAQQIKRTLPVPVVRDTLHTSCFPRAAFADRAGVGRQPELEDHAKSRQPGV
jgi:hypothetical protein